MPLILVRSSHLLSDVLKCVRSGASIKRVFSISLSTSLLSPILLAVPVALLVPMSIIRMSAGLKVPGFPTCGNWSKSVLVSSLFTMSKLASCRSPCVILFSLRVPMHSSVPAATFNACA